MLPDMDIAGQVNLINSSVLIVGMGGLGCPASMYLAAAGVGHLFIADDDVVEITNLQRQIAHGHINLGESKVKSAASILRGLNKDVEVTTIQERLEGKLLDELVSKVDVVVDCCDNYSTRFAINASCWSHSKPLVFGAAIRMEGQIAVFDGRESSSPCYQCLYQEDGEDETCSTNGVISPVVGIIGSLQAMEAIKIIANVGRTLIGRLLYDSKNIFEDQIQAVEESSKKRGDDHINLALLTDGLKAEREQGITIDVAYRYFATPKRKFIIADTPGHIQYTRNMVTGASTANLAIILVDARKGIVEQTCRHAFIANLLRIQHVIVAINKMDLVDYDEAVYESIIESFKSFSSRLGNFIDVTFIPISALNGDNVVDRSDKMTWYSGSTLLYHLESVYIGSDRNHVQARFPVQWVIRPHSNEHHDFRGYAGRVAGGVFKPGDEVQILPSGFTSEIESIHTADGPMDEVFSPLSCSLLLKEDIDISRGDMIVKVNNPPQRGQDIEAMLCWFSDKKMMMRGKYSLRHTTKEVKAIVSDLQYKININTLRKIEDDKEFGMNEIGRVSIRTSSPIYFDSYENNRTTGSFILVDDMTNETVAAGMIS